MIVKGKAERVVPAWEGILRLSKLFELVRSSGVCTWFRIMVQVIEDLSVGWGLGVSDALVHAVKLRIVMGEIPLLCICVQDEAGKGSLLAERGSRLGWSDGSRRGALLGLSRVWLCGVCTDRPAGGR
jgi:hypothetical protein